MKWVGPSDGRSYNVWPLSYHSFMHLFIYLSNVYMRGTGQDIEDEHNHCLL